MDGKTDFEVGSLPEAFLTPTAGVAETFHRVKGLQHVRLTLTNFVVSVLEANDYGSAKLVDFGDTNLLLVGAEANLTLLKGGAVNGIINTKDLDVAVGTAAASNTTLSTTMLNILPKVDCDADTLADVVKSHSLAATPVLTGILEGTPAAYLNVSVIGGITASDIVTFSGTLDLFYFNLENVTS